MKEVSRVGWECLLFGSSVTKACRRYDAHVSGRRGGTEVRILGKLDNSMQRRQADYLFAELDTIIETFERLCTTSSSLAALNCSR